MISIVPSCLIKPLSSIMQLLFKTMIYLVSLPKINLITTLSIITSSIIILITTWLISGNFVTQITYYSISPDFSSQLVLKQDKNTGKINDYHYTYLCFAKKTTSFNASSIKKISTRWLTNDCNYISYQKEAICEFIIHFSFLEIIFVIGHVKNLLITL